ncbi:hypothetical protein ZIOFF_017487 [Zingiber officinale]|uniref:DNA/RNA-binding protein Alba-like domain-containing protein n=1 Tax=Zingiber officinale TaxID=94328 RepID=A0A8J5HT67_ZINOF|nr:hypothetical protein ZIOFF_017487 [Zingiber officinale]
MDRYQKVEQPRPESTISENEVRITSQGVIRNYVSYATSLFQQDKLVREIVLKAMGQAISKAVAVAEIVKKRNRGLYQDTAISSVSITDVWEPIEEGLVPLSLNIFADHIVSEYFATTLMYQVPLEQPRRQPRYQQPQQQLQFKIKQERNQFNEGTFIALMFFTY